MRTDADNNHDFRLAGQKIPHEARERAFFAGTARRSRVAVAAGLTTLADDDFGAGPQVPLVRETWAQSRDVG